MRVVLGGTEYDWLDRWARLPDGEGVDRAWPHASIAWASTGELWTSHPSRRELLAFGPTGDLRRRLVSPVAEAHGITAVEEDGLPSLWLADAGQQRTAESDYRSPEDDRDAAVVHVDLGGHELARLERPGHPAYRDGKYRPTGIAVDERRFGGGGDLWVADGYGSSLVHRYTADGTLVGTLTGEEGAGRFRGPHAVHIDRRRAEPELYVADRGNARLQVFGLDGRFHRTVGAGTLSSPTAFVELGERLGVLEYFPPRLIVLDDRDRLSDLIGENVRPVTQPEFPFVRDAGGRPATPRGMGEGRFGVPHGITADAAGSLYVSEVVFGSTFTKLARVGAVPAGEGPSAP